MAKTGSCQCGSVHYELECKPITVYACHCLECQRQTASAFELSVPVRTVDLKITGNLAVYRRPADSGAFTDCRFCAACGTRIYHQSVQSPEIVTIKAGTLSDTTMLNPVAHLWVSRKQPWLVLPEGVPSFDTQPEDLRSWRDALLP